MLMPLNVSKSAIDAEKLYCNMKLFLLNVTVKKITHPTPSAGPLTDLSQDEQPHGGRHFAMIKGVHFYE